MPPTPLAGDDADDGRHSRTALAGLLGHGTPKGNRSSGCKLCRHLLGLRWLGGLRGWLHPTGGKFSRRGGISSSSRA